MGIGVGLCRPVKGLEYKRVVIALADHIRDDTPVIQIQNSAKIQLVLLHTLIPLKLRHIGKPFLVRFGSLKLAVEKVVRKILRTFCPPCTAVAGVLYCGTDVACSAYTQNPLVIDLDAVIMFQIIPNAAVALVRALLVDALNDLGKLFIPGCPVALLAGSPFVVCSTRDL